MAARFWVLGTGTWDASTTTHWSTTTGGSGGASVPGTTDDVTFDANSGGGVITVSGTVNAQNYTAAGFTGSFTGGQININGNSNLGGRSYATGLLHYGAGAQTLTMGGATSTSTIFIGNSASQGTYTLQDAMSVAATVSHQSGTWNTNNQTCSWGGFTSNVTNTRTLTLGSSAITVPNGTWSINSQTGLTMTTNTATLTMAGVAAVFAQVGDMKGTTVIMTCSGAATIGILGSTSPTVAAFTRTGTAVKTDSMTIRSSALNVTGTCTLNANSSINRLLVQANVVGTAATITAGSLVCTNVIDFQDITGGGTATWTAAASGATFFGDCGGNSGITFTTPATQTWSGNTTGNWSVAANWTSRVPLPQDNVAVTGLTSGTITADMPRLGASIDFTGSTGGTLSPSVNATIFGSLTLAANMTLPSGGSWTFGGRGNHTITCHGVVVGPTPSWMAVGGTYTLVDDFICNLVPVGNLANLFTGTLTAQGNVTLPRFSFNQIHTVATTLNMGPGAWTFYGTGTVWSTFLTNFTLNSQTSTILISDTSSTAKTFAGNGLAYNNLTVTGGQGTSVAITGANTFNAPVVVTNPDTVLTWPSSTTNTVAGLSATGSPNAYIYVPQGVTGQSASIPDNALYQISGDIDIRSLVWFDVANPGQTLCIGPTRDDGSTNRSYAFRLISGGLLNFFHSATGAGTSSATASTAIATPTGPLWYRVTWTAATGATKFYTSPDNITYTQLGTTQTIDAGTTTWTGGTVSQFLIGNGGSYPPSGKYYRTQLYNGINGTLVYDANFAAKAFGANSFTESSVNAATVTINGTMAQAGDGRILINSSAAGTAATLSSSSRVNLDYVTVQDSTAAGNTPFYAGPHGVLVSGDTNWLPQAAPSLGGTLTLLGVG